MTTDRVTKEQWLQGALDFIVEQGIVGMTPERLATALGTSRSSFYWHFTDQAEFRRQVINFWAEACANNMREHLIGARVAPAERLEKLIQLVHGNGESQYEVAVHALASGNPGLIAIIDRAYQARSVVVRSILSDYGVARDRLEAVTALLVCYLSWRTETVDCGQRDSVLDDREFLADLLGQPEDAPRTHAG